MANEDTPSVDLGHYSSALRVRDAIRSIATTVVNDLRPLPRYGTTISGLNIFTNKVMVLLNGDTTPVPVSITRSHASFDIGTVVRVEGRLNDLYITKIMNGRVAIKNPVLSGPYICGGAFGNSIISTWAWSQSVNAPSLGQNAWVGRWEASEAFQNVGGVIEVGIYWNAFGTLAKLYRIPFNFNITSGAWVKVFPTEDSGAYNGWDVGLEMAVDGTGFELRCRSYGTGTGFSPSNWGCIIRTVTATFKSMPNVISTSAADAIPSAALNVLTSTVAAGTMSKGHLQSPAVANASLTQDLLHGGGAVSYNGDLANNYLLWTDRFTIYGLGNNEYAPGNGFYIPVPAAGVSVPVFDNATVTTRATVAGGIQLLAGEALYYELPLGQGTINAGQAGDPSYMRIISNTSTTVINQYVPAHWILIARVSQDSSHGSVKLGTGEIIDQLHLLTLTGFVNATAPEAQCGYRKIGGQQTILQGTILPTAIVAANVTTATIATVPQHFRPRSTRRFIGWANPSPMQPIRITITSAGLVTITNGSVALATTTTLALECSWIAEL